MKLLIYLNKIRPKIIWICEIFVCHKQFDGLKLLVYTK